MPPYHHLLFATDLSPINQDMRHKILELASLFKARLTVVHVITSISSLSRNYSLVVGLQETLEKEAKESLKKFCEPLKIPESDQIIKVGQPAVEIIETIKEKDIDLLLLGRYGESGIGHLIGSVSHRLIHRSPAEVLLINS